MTVSGETPLPSDQGEDRRSRAVASRGTGGAYEPDRAEAPVGVDVRALRELLAAGRADEAEELARTYVRSVSERLDVETTDRVLDLVVGILRGLRSDLSGERSSDVPGDAGRCGESECMGTLGAYRLLEKIGHGAQGDVFLAEDTRLARRVALKVLAAPLSLSDSARRRFHREAAVASRLDDAGICPIYELGEVAGVQYIAMRHVEGLSLHRLVAEARERGERIVRVPGSRSALSRDSGGESASSDGPPGAETPLGRIFRVVRLIERIARALHSGHEAGVVHRDVKPGNIMVTADGEPVVLDFGLARDEASAAEGLTITGDVLGTPAYVAPEQLSGMNVDCRTDVFALGVTLYECLALERPFDGPTRESLYRRILSHEPTPLRRHNRDVPRDLEVVVSTALEKDPARRYTTALDLAEDLRRVREYEPIRARPAGAVLRFRRWTQRNPLLATTALGLFLALSIGLTSTLSLLGHAERERAQKETALRDSLVSQANALQASGQPGQRVAALEALSKATRLRSGPDLRDEAIRALSLPDLKVARKSSEYPDGIPSVFHDPDFRRYAAVDANGDLHIRRSADHEIELTLTHAIAWPSRPYRIEWSPPASHLAIEDPVGVTLWDLHRRSQLLTREGSAGSSLPRFGPEGRIFCLSRRIEPSVVDGRMAGSGISHSIEIRHVAATNVLARFDASGPPADLCFSPDGATLAVACVHSAAVELRNAHDGSVARVLRFPGAVDRLAWAPSGDVLAAGGAARAWCLRSDGATEPLVTFPGHSGTVAGLAFTHDGDLLLTTSQDSTARLWDPFSGRQLLRVVTGNWDGSPRIARGDRLLAFSANLVEEPHCFELVPVLASRRWYSPSAMARGFEFSPDGHWAVGMEEEGLQVWRTSDGRRLGSLQIESGTTVLFDPRGGAFFTDGLEVLRWRVDVLAGGEIRVHRPESVLSTGSALRLWDCASDGRALALRSGDSRGIILRLGDPASPLVLEEGGAVTALALHPDGELVVTAGPEGTRVRNARDGARVRELPGERVRHLTFSSHGRFLVIETPDSFTFWCTETWQRVRELVGVTKARGNWRHVAFSPAGDLVAISRVPHQVMLLDATTLRDVAVLENPVLEPMGWFRFTRSGDRLAAGPYLRIWDLRSIRRELVQLGLDWNTPAYVPAPAGGDLPERVHFMGRRR